MELQRTTRGYESITLSMEPDYENDRTIYTVMDMRQGKFNHNLKGRFDTYYFTAPCEAMAMYERLSAEFEADNAKADGKEVE